MVFVQYTIFSIMFLLEVFGLIAFTSWGFYIGKGMLMKLILGLGTPIIIIIFWGIFVAPKASLPVSVPLRISLQLLILGLAAAALYFSGKQMLAILFFIAVLITLTLMYLV